MYTCVRKIILNSFKKNHGIIFVFDNIDFLQQLFIFLNSLTVNKNFKWREAIASLAPSQL